MKLTIILLMMLLPLVSCDKKEPPAVSIDRQTTKIEPAGGNAEVSVRVTVACDGNDFVHSRGIIYSRPGEERTVEKGNMIESGAGTGSFTVTFEVNRTWWGIGEEKTMKYWIRGFAINSQGPGYSEEETWVETATWNTP